MTTTTEAAAEQVLVAKARQLCASGIAAERLERAGTSHGEAGRAVGVSHVTIYRWLAGQRRPTGAAAARFATFLDQLVASGVA